MRTNVPRALRALRLRRRWRQQDLGRRAGLSRDVVQRVEVGELRGVRMGSLERLANALGAELAVLLRWRGADLDRLIDEAHARMVTLVARRLERVGWVYRVEVSFNHFGDRGRCDLVAWHPATSTLLIVEVKTRVGDLQELVGRLDVKLRLGALIAREAGWGRPDCVVGAVVLAEGGTNRRVVRRNEPMFRRFGVRGRSAHAWLRSPRGVHGLLWFESPDTGEGRNARATAPAGRRVPAEGRT